MQWLTNTDLIGFLLLKLNSFFAFDPQLVLPSPFFFLTLCVYTEVLGNVSVDWAVSE